MEPIDSNTKFTHIARSFGNWWLDRFREDFQDVDFRGVQRALRDDSRERIWTVFAGGILCHLQRIIIRPDLQRCKVLWVKGEEDTYLQLYIAGVFR